MILGTAAYMSPSRRKGKPVDKRADIWASACVLYEMLTGQRAFAWRGRHRHARGGAQAATRNGTPLGATLSLGATSPASAASRRIRSSGAQAIGDAAPGDWRAHSSRSPRGRRRRNDSSVATRRTAWSGCLHYAVCVARGLRRWLFPRCVTLRETPSVQQSYRFSDRTASQLPASQRSGCRRMGATSLTSQLKTETGAGEGTVDS